MAHHLSPRTGRVAPVWALVLGCTLSTPALPTADGSTGEAPGITRTGASGGVETESTFSASHDGGSSTGIDDAETGTGRASSTGGSGESSSGSSGTAGQVCTNPAEWGDAITVGPDELSDEVLWVMATPVAALADDGSFAVAWIPHQGGAVRMQRFEPDGTAIDGAVDVSADDDSPFANEPGIGSSADGAGGRRLGRKRERTRPRGAWGVCAAIRRGWDRAR